MQIKDFISQVNSKSNKKDLVSYLEDNISRIETIFYQSNFDSLNHARQNNFTLFERLGRPDEISPGAVFLASDESSFMTGSDLLMDGGFTAI